MQAFVSVTKRQQLINRIIKTDVSFPFLSCQEKLLLHILFYFYGEFLLQQRILDVG